MSHAPDEPGQSGSSAVIRGAASRSSRLRFTPSWVIGAAIGLAVGLVLAVGGGQVIQALRSDGGSTADVSPARPSAEPSPAAGAEAVSQFAPAPDLCEAPDLSPVFDIVDSTELADDNEMTGGLYQRSCQFRLGDDSSLGHLRVYAAIHEEEQGAENSYEDKVTSAIGAEPEQLDGDWDEGAVLIPPGADSEASVQLVVRDGVLVVDLWNLILGDAADVDVQQAALVRVAGNICEVMRSSGKNM